jgi:hypothetical protein
MPRPLQIRYLIPIQSCRFDQTRLNEIGLNWMSRGAISRKMTSNTVTATPPFSPSTWYALYSVMHIYTHPQDTCTTK